MKIGDKVKISSKKNIIMGLDGSSRHRELLFDQRDMIHYCGKVGILNKFKSKGRNGIIWALDDTGWWWHEDWLTLVDFFTDKDFDI